METSCTRRVGDPKNGVKRSFGTSIFSVTGGWRNSVGTSSYGTYHTYMIYRVLIIPNGLGLCSSRVGRFEGPSLSVISRTGP